MFASCQLFSGGRTKKQKMALIYCGISLGMFAFTLLILGILLGLEIIEIRGTEQQNSCVLPDQPCTFKADKNAEDGDPKALFCCPPFVCRPNFQLFTDLPPGQVNKNKVPGKCVQPNQSSDSKTTTEKGQPMGSSRPPASQCPYSAKLEQILETVRNGEEFDHTLEFYDKAIEGYLHASSYRGNAERNFLLTVRDLNTEAQLISGTLAKVGNNIYPLIVATESANDLNGVGGTFTIFYEDGSSESVNPVSEEYEIRKGLSHIPLAIFGILGPYFRVTYASTWVKQLISFGQKVNDTIMAIKALVAESSAEPSASPSAEANELHTDSLTMLDISSQYIVHWLTQSTQLANSTVPKTVTVEEYQEYADEVFPYLSKSVRIAADLQMKAVVPVLKRWKEGLGEEKWKGVYAVIPTVWPVTAINSRFQAIASVMTPEQAKNQIFNIENGGTVENLRKILGKIISHRTAAHLIFGTKNQRRRELNFALSGRQDLMSNDAEDTLKNIFSTIVKD